MLQMNPMFYLYAVPSKHASLLSPKFLQILLMHLHQITFLSHNCNRREHLSTIRVIDVFLRLLNSATMLFLVMDIEHRNVVVYKMSHQSYCTQNNIQHTPFQLYFVRYTIFDSNTRTYGYSWWPLVTFYKQWYAWSEWCNAIAVNNSFLS